MLHIWGNKTNLKKDYHLKEGNYLDDSGWLQEESCMHHNKGDNSFAKNVACYILSYIQAKGIVVWKRYELKNKQALKKGVGIGKTKCQNKTSHK